MSTLSKDQEKRLAEVLTPHFLGGEQEALVKLGTVAVNVSEEVLADDLAGLQAQLDDLHSSDGAGLVGIEDEAGNFISTTVEGALKELAEVGTAGFNPASDQTITGKWEFTEPLDVTTINLSEDYIGVATLSGDQSYTFPDKSGTFALVEDVPVLSAGSGISITGTFPNRVITATGGGGGGGNFDPSDDQNITGNWSFSGNLSLTRGSYGGFLSTTTLTGNRTYTLPNKSGTVAMTSDIPAQVALTAGSNVNITGTYPNLTISATGGGGGGGAVNSVNAQIGDVLLTYLDVGAAASVHYHSAADITTGSFPISVLPVGTGSGQVAAGNHTHSEATTSSAGFMSAADKAKLNSIAANATASSGTVTSVNVTGSTGLSASGGPITNSGTISLTLSSNLQSWSGISPSSKQNYIDGSGLTRVTTGSGPPGGMISGELYLRF